MGQDIKELFTKAVNFNKYAYKVSFVDGFFGVFARRWNIDEGKEWFEGWVVKKDLLKKAGLFGEFRFRVDKTVGFMYALFHDHLKKTSFREKTKFELKINVDENIAINKDITDFIESLFGDKPYLKELYLIDDMAFLVYYGYRGIIQAVYFFNWRAV